MVKETRSLFFTWAPAAQLVSPQPGESAADSEPRGLSCVKQSRRRAAGGTPVAAVYSNSPISSSPEWAPGASSSDSRDDVTVERTNEFLTSDLLTVLMQAANSNYHNPG